MHNVQNKRKNSTFVIFFYYEFLAPDLWHCFWPLSAITSIIFALFHVSVDTCIQKQFKKLTTNLMPQTLTLVSSTYWMLIWGCWPWFLQRCIKNCYYHSYPVQGIKVIVLRINQIGCKLIYWIRLPCSFVFLLSKPPHVITFPALNHIETPTTSPCLTVVPKNTQPRMTALLVAGQQLY